jgi:hypothetical protein
MNIYISTCIFIFIKRKDPKYRSDLKSNQLKLIFFNNIYIYLCKCKCIQKKTQNLKNLK